MEEIAWRRNAPDLPEVSEDSIDCTNHPVILEASTTELDEDKQP